MARKYKDFEKVLVREVIMDESHHRYVNTEDIGTILFTGIDEGYPGEACATCFQARPINYNISHYPLPGEIVHIMVGPLPGYHFTGAANYYYFPPIGMGNSPGGNFEPDFINEKGNFYAGKYYTLNEDLRPLRPYEGDIMIEGRYGNSIRFGSTTFLDVEYPNHWSNEGTRGNPITIIRNGQSTKFDPDNPKSSYEHIVEDINEDASSIWLCSQQQIDNFVPASIHDASYLTDLHSKERKNEVNHPNNTMDINTKEDVNLKSTSNLPAAELQKLDELKDLQNSNVAHYDASPTENQLIDQNQPIDYEGLNIPINSTIKVEDLEAPAGEYNMNP